MALTLPYTAPFKSDFPDAYFRVTKVDLDVPAHKAVIEYWIYVEADTRVADEQATVTRQLLAVYDTPEASAYTTYFGAEALSAAGMNPLAAAYAYLKSLGSFAGATDC